MKAALVTATRRGSIIHLWLRSEDGRKIKVNVHGFKPYFYIPSKMGEYNSVFGEKLEKIVLEDPSDVRRYRENYPKHYEADIPFTRRFVIDTGLYLCVELPNISGFEASVDYKELRPCSKVDVKYRVWFLDIEVYSSVLPSSDNPEYPIIAISVYDTFRDKYITWAWHKKFKNTTISAKYESKDWEVRTFKEEELMLMDFIAQSMEDKPDFILGWNVRFDYDYLTARTKKLNLAYSFDYVSPFDLLGADKAVVKGRRGRALKKVTVEEGLESKETAIEASDIIPLWEENPIEVVKYNVRDVWRIVKLNERYRYFETYLAYKEVTGLVDLEETLSALLIVDIMVLRTAKKIGLVLPSTEKREKKSYKGAVVLKPTPGLYENVAVFDMSKYYPSLIISFNISPEKKLKQIDRVNNIWEFKQDSPGILPLSVRNVVIVEENLRREQSKYKPGDLMYEVLDRKILATKGVRNAFYGVTAKERFRLFDPDVASTITGLGREGILYLKHVSEKMGYKVRYGDTDSIFIEVPFDEANRLAEKLTEKLKTYFRSKYNLQSNPILELKFEKYYKRVLFTEAKKRYAGWLVWKKGKETDKIDITGFEAVRTDTAFFTVNAQHRVMGFILRNGLDFEGLDKVVKELVEEFNNSSLDEIALYANMTKPPSEYVSKTKPPHVRAAIYSNMYLGTKFTAGDKIKYVWVRRVKGLPPTDVVAFERAKDIEDKVEVDYEKMINRVLWSPLKRIFEVIGYSYGASRRRWW